MNPILRERRVLLVDDHPVFREGLRAVVNSHPCLNVVAEAGSAAEALSLLSALSPEVMITDLRLAQSSGHDLIEEALRLNSELLVVVVSVNSNSADVLRAIQAGAVAYLTKGASREELLRALSEVLEGRSFLHAEVAHVICQKVRQSAQIGAEILYNTPREQDILEMLCQGRSPREISQVLFLSVSTVKTHMRNLYRKMGVSTRAQLMLKVLEQRNQALA